MFYAEDILVCLPKCEIFSTSLPFQSARPYRQHGRSWLRIMTNYSQNEREQKQTRFGRWIDLVS